MCIVFLRPRFCVFPFIPYKGTFKKEMNVKVLFGIGLKSGLNKILIFSDRVKPSVQKVSITYFVENLIKQNLPLGENCMDSVNRRRFLSCSALAMSFLSCGMYISAAHVRFLLAAVRRGW